ncbi:MAG TPA: DHCW motif cupin fold protein [Alphaproteobacteria bacterium]|nr:DHCW motif cupin fold protein [Alphaproteobacteria bacterium]
MRIENVPFATADWALLPASEIRGESGTARERTVEAGNLRLRMVEFSPGYRADHWCPRGHVVLVLEGALTTELKDGRRFESRAGTSFQVADGDGFHLVSTAKGAKVFIVD